jgi:hypothetical protein
MGFLGIAVFITLICFSHGFNVNRLIQKRNIQLRMIVNEDFNAKVLLPIKETSYKRFAAVTIALSSCLLSFGCASFAADKGAGTITDKKYELCVSKCVFSETRPPPNGADNERILTTISRTDIIKDCRKSCAKTKEQLLLGKPKVKVASAVIREE